MTAIIPVVQALKTWAYSRVPPKRMWKSYNWKAAKIKSQRGISRKTSRE